MRIFSLVRQQRRTYWVGAAIGAAGSILGGLLGRSSGNSFDPYTAVLTTQMQKDLFDYQFNRQLEAMNSAHQREVTDLRKAGLNPILSATGGSGLSAPTGAMPDISSVNSAVTSSRQANRQMIMNALSNMADIVVRHEANKINDKSASAAMLDAQANLQNANSNSVNSATQALERFAHISKMSYEQKKILYEMNLINSQMALNSANAMKAQTDAYVSRSLLPSNISKNYQSGGTTSIPNKIFNQGFDQLNYYFNSAKQYLLNKFK